jgi:hypothetical protein
MPRPEGSEQLVSDLLTVTAFAPKIQSASTPCRERADAWERMRSNSAYESGFHLSGNRTYTLGSLEDGPLAVHHDELVWHPGKKIVYHQASPDLSKRKVRGRYKGSKGRAFFTPYHGMDDETKVRYCRHYAAGLYFRQWAG